MKYGHAVLRQPEQCGIKHHAHVPQRRANFQLVGIWWKWTIAASRSYNIVCSDLGSDSTYLTFYANCILHGDEFAKA
jgi:hypothetical protein